MSATHRHNLRRLRKYSRRLNRMLEDGSFEGLPESRRHRLVGRLRVLAEGLYGVVSEVTLRHILAGAAVIVLGVAGCAKSPPDITSDADVGVDTIGDATDATDARDAFDVPEGFDADDGWDAPDGVDATDATDTTDATDATDAQDTTDAMDAADATETVDVPDATDDGGSGGIAFVYRGVNMHGITSVSCYYAIPALADMDGDGDFDLFVGASSYYYANGVHYYRNDGTATAPSFASPTLNPFGITTSGDYLGPALGDLDGDGDIDLIMSSTDWYTSTFQYYRNDGTASAPSFAAAQTNPFGLSMASYTYAWLGNVELVDLDDDGDLDLLYGDYNADIRYFENTGSATAPAFTDRGFNPMGLVARSDLAAPAGADLDDDADQDLMIGDGWSHFYYQENTGTATAPTFGTPRLDPFGLTPTVSYYVFPAFVDIDGDGDEDLYVGDYDDIRFYENVTP
jgi:hypothetical protein